MSKKNENNPQGKKNNFIPMLVLVLLIIAVLMIIASLGFGGSLGNNSEDYSNSGIAENTIPTSEQESSSEETETIPEETTEETKYINVTVSENTYNINGEEKSIDDIIALAKENKNTVVKITDNNAVVDSMDSLISSLSENSISYIEPTE